MFDSLVGAAQQARGAAGVGAWARVENAACARRLAATAEVFGRALAASGSAEREQWCIDNWAMVAAQVAAEQNISAGVASGQLEIALALRERLPKVAALFATGAVSLRTVRAVVARTRLIQAPKAMAQVDTAITGSVRGWASLSQDKLEAAVDVWVDRYDPAALRRTEITARGRGVHVEGPRDGNGLTELCAVLFVHDAAALDARVDSIADTVCARDPRSADQRRADALGALGHGAERLTCGCGTHDCPAAAVTPSSVVVHVITHEDTLHDTTELALDGDTDAPPPGEPHPAGPAAAPPAVVLGGGRGGGGVVPGPLLAATVAAGAAVVPIVHPRDAPPEPRYRPSPRLAAFVRCRDMTCRFPGCEHPAFACDLDHTIAYPAGPTCASNLTALCRKHHLLKTFCGWTNHQDPEGTVVWRAPDGRTYTTHPASGLLFPTLCAPTAPVVIPDLPDTATPDAASTAARTLRMPRRHKTRAQNRTAAINQQRKLNNDYVTERNKPPPF